MSFVYNKYKTRIMTGLVDFREAGIDARTALIKLKANTTTDTETDVEFLSGFTTLGELVATNYARTALANQAVNEDLANDRAEFDADDVTNSSLGGVANDDIGAILLFEFLVNDAASPPIAYIDDGGSDFNLTTNGSDVVQTWDAEGILQLT